MARDAFCFSHGSRKGITSLQVAMISIYSNVVSIWYFGDAIKDFYVEILTVWSL